MKKNVFLSALVLALLLPVSGIQAQPASLGFELDLEEGWHESPSPYQGVAASYALAGSGARLDISVQDKSPQPDVGVLSWQDLFYPQFDAIDIQMDARTSIDGVPAKYCLYKIKKSPFKKQLEGKRDLMYLNYVIIRGGRLYSLTFSDDEAAFSENQPDFMKMVRTIRFAGGA